MNKIKHHHQASSHQPKHQLKWLFCMSIISGLFATSLFASPLTIDDFENKTSLIEPEWWLMGSPTLTFIQNPELEPEEDEDNGGFSFDDEEVQVKTGKTSLSVTGKANLWYVGGMGTFLAVDTRMHNAIELTIFGNKDRGGRLKIELYDDDNGNWKIEPSKQYPSRPGKDDKFSYFVELDWDGWKKITIPFKHFLDENKTIGDNIWNPFQTGASGGLIQMQLLFFSDSKKGKIDIDIDNIQFVKSNDIANDLN